MNILIYIVLIVIVLYYFICVYNVETVKLEKFDTTAKQNNKLIYYFAKWCGHCNSYMNTWYDLKKRYGDKIQFIEIDCSNVPNMSEQERNKLMPEYVKGFPYLEYVDAKGNVTPIKNRNDVINELKL